FSASITMGLVRKGPAAFADCGDPPLAKPLELPSRSDVVGTLPSGVLDSRVSPRRTLRRSRALGCRSAMSARAERPLGLGIADRGAAWPRGRGRLLNRCVKIL